MDDARAKALIEEYRESADPTILDELVRGLTPLLTSLVRRHAFSGEGDEDLLQVAYIGLLNAISRFQDNGEAKFTTYACAMAEGEILHHKRDRSLIKEPRWVRAMNRRINDAIEELQQELGRLPNISEISDHINVTEEGVMECLKIRQDCQILSLDAESSDDEPDFSPEKVRSKKLESFHLPIEDRISIENAIDSLTGLQKKVVYYLFYMDLTQTEVAKRLGLNQRKISRVRQQAVSNLRKSLSDEEEDGDSSST